MKVLIYGINYAPELTGIGKYTGEMAQWLAAAGVQVKVVTAPPYYPDWKVADGFSSVTYQKEVVDGVEIIRCPLYVPKTPSTGTRLLHLLSFAFTSFWALLTQVTWRADTIVVIEPSLFCAPGALLLSVLSGSKTVLHIQDYEMDAMFGLGMMRSVYIAKLAFAFEQWLMGRFDWVSSISYSKLNREIEKGVKANKTLFFPNWVDTEFIRPDVSGISYRETWGFSEQHKLVLYSGNIGKKQGLEIVLDVAQLFQRDVVGNSLQFLIVGEGTHRAELERLAKQKNLNNLHFKNLVPYEDLPKLMAMADIHLVVQKKGAADAVLPSKLTSILSVGGHSLVTAKKDTELGLLVQKHPGIAELIEPENVNDFISGLKRLLTRDIKAINKVARNYAVNHLKRDAVLSRFKQDILELCDQSYD